MSVKRTHNKKEQPRPLVEIESDFILIAPEMGPAQVPLQLIWQSTDTVDIQLQSFISLFSLCAMQRKEKIKDLRQTPAAKENPSDPVTIGKAH